MPDILVIDAHPATGSLCSGLADTYQAETGARRLNLRDLSFDPNLRVGYRGEQPWEPDLAEAWGAIVAAKHLVFVYPVWWGTYPALLKGFIDRTFLPGKAFKFHPGGGSWDQLLAGRSARLIVTMDTPGLWYTLAVGAPGRHAMRIATLRFCGVAPVSYDELTPASRADAATRDAWHAKVRARAAADHRRLAAR